MSRPPRLDRTRRAARAAALAVVLGLALTGCAELGPPKVPTPGSTTTTPSPTPLPATADAFRDARTHALSALSAHATGTLGAGSTMVRIDLDGEASGANQRLARTVPGRGTAVLLTVGDGRWLAGDEEFWRTRTTKSDVLRERVGSWVQVTPAVAEEVGSETLRSVLGAALAAPAVARLEGVSAPVTEEDLDGRPTWVLGSAATGARVWLVADGGGEVARISVTGTGALDLTFDRWDRARTWSAPAPGEVPQVP